MVDAHHFTFRRTPDGVAHTRLEFTVLAYDANGKLINFTEHAFGLDPARQRSTPQIMSRWLFPSTRRSICPQAQFSLAHRGTRPRQPQGRR